jgi:hypothetical protein
MHQFHKFILFWNNTLHVSDCLSVHHQKFKTVLQQQVYVKQILLPATRQQYLFDIYLLLCVQP